MNTLTYRDTERLQLISRMDDIVEQIKLHIENLTNPETVFDKVVECYVLLEKFKNRHLTHKYDNSYIWDREKIFDTLLYLVSSTSSQKALYKKMIKQGFNWLNDFNYDNLRTQLLIYYNIKITNPGAIKFRASPAPSIFSDEEISDFGKTKPQLIQHTLIYDVQPDIGKFLDFPLDQRGAEDFWKYYNLLMQHAITEKTIEPYIESLENN